MEVSDNLDVHNKSWLGQVEEQCLVMFVQVEFIEACVALDKLKPAARAVRQLGLQAEFPNIEALYRQRSLARLVGKRLWSVALSFVGSDAALQVGRRATAPWGYPSSPSFLIAGQHSVADQHAATHYLQLLELLDPHVYPAVSMAPVEAGM